MSRQTHVFLFALSVGLLMTATNASAYPSEKGEDRGTVRSPYKIDIGSVEGLRTAQHPSPGNVAGAGCPGVAILNADPADGTTDARQPFGPGDDPSDPAARQGIGSAGEPIVLALDVVGLGAECFAICESNPDAVLGANAIASVTEGPPGTYAIVLNHAIAPGEVSNIRVGGTATVVYLSLPADSNADDVSNANDVLALIDALNGVIVPPFGVYSVDIDHSGAFNASDVLRIIDLLNGGGNLDEWLGATAPSNDACQSCGPGAGDCCENNGPDSPGCNDVDCCDCVCSFDAFCCDNTWDQSCANCAAGTGGLGNCTGIGGCISDCPQCTTCGSPGTGDCLQFGGT
ncbi:MAG: hypothetical protein IID36_08060, partial [Planctomycetes bacterium]|nr:hypothetical protein [Planctomycetota bacterium]